MQSWLNLFKNANRVAGRPLFSAELLSELSTSLDHCTDVAFICQAVYMIVAELPSIKNAMLRKKKASEFIGSHRVEALGESISKRLLAFKSGHCGAAPKQAEEEEEPLQKKLKVDQE